ncbi:hypothetical protein TWF506_004751 [Arthrobotrys conoides]|uniref:Uncharacterized protein n=1 Tax=Arthrobotrys conoides TaxID=74498 RepID=A0AAN8MWI0_9PEZI
MWKYDWTAWLGGRGGAIDAITSMQSKRKGQCKCTHDDEPYFVEGPDGELQHNWDTINGLDAGIWNIATWDKYSRPPGVLWDRDLSKVENNIDSGSNDNAVSEGDESTVPSKTAKESEEISA